MFLSPDELTVKMLKIKRKLFSILPGGGGGLPTRRVVTIDYWYVE